jgi:hypothetical protein
MKELTPGGFKGRTGPELFPRFGETRDKLWVPMSDLDQTRTKRERPIFWPSFSVPFSSEGHPPPRHSLVLSLGKTATKRSRLAFRLGPKRTKRTLVYPPI